MTALLDLIDSKIRLWHKHDCVFSPGYSWFDGNQYHFGVPALRTSRRTPKAVNTRFWSQLSTQPLAPPLGPARHTGDLAHQHLEALHRSAHQPSTCLLTVPNTMNREQLSLLLGIVQHLPFTIDGLVHRTALLAANSGLARGKHVEVQLHQTVVTGFEEQGGVIKALESQTLPGQGLLALQDALATRISDIFVAQTRFDPLRSADAEQALYDALPQLLTQLKAATESRLSLSGYDARITVDDLTAVGVRFGQQLRAVLSANDVVLLEDPLELLPGMSLDVPVHAIDSSLLPSLAAKQGVALKQEANNLLLQRSVPTSTNYNRTSTNHNKAAQDGPDRAAGKTTQAIVDSASSPRRPTHLLQGYVARPLGSGTPINGTAYLHNDGDRVSLEGELPAELLVNGQPATANQLLALGDVLSDGLNFNATLIYIEP